MEKNDMDHFYQKYSFLLTTDKIHKVNDISLNELGYLVMNLEDFLSSQSDIICHKSSIVPNLTELVVSFGLVKTFQEAEDRDYDAGDFPFEAKNAEESFKYLNCLLEHYESIDTTAKRKFLVPVLLLCATHNAKYFWSSEESVALSKEFLKNLLQCSKHKNLSILLCDDTFHPTIFKAILKRMRPGLMKDNWMNNPSNCHIFYWLLSHIKHPYLIDYTYDVLPPSFMFSSYYAVPQQVLGIKCFDHTLDNVPPSLITADGTEDAIFDALKKYIYYKDIPIIEVLYPCLLKLPMMNLQKVNHLQWLQFDIVLQQLLQNVDMESNPKLRHLFLTQIYLFIKSTPCFKHLKKSLNVLLQNFTANSIAEEECRIVSLKIMKELIRSCWPRMNHHCQHIILAILKIIYDIEKPSYTPDDTCMLEVSEQILLLCKECLLLLKHACSETFMNLVEEYLQGNDSMPGTSLLKEIL